MSKLEKIQIIKSASTDAIEAVQELANQITIKNITGIIFFCSSNYNLETLSNQINKSFDVPIVGCTTAGEITDTYSTDSMVALVLNADFFSLHSHLIEDLKDFNLTKAMKVSSSIEKELDFSQSFVTNKSFGFLLSDGLLLQEERVTSLIHQAMGDINILGGSVADDFKLIESNVFYNNSFYKDSSVFIFLELVDNFGIFRIQHFEPTEKEIITTEVDFKNRIVKEINGEPAALAYAKINNIDPENLNHIDFAMYPLMLQIADKWYIRSISKVLPDNSLKFHCAIDFGLPLNIGNGKDLVQKLEDEVNEIVNIFDEIYFTIGCDCILRRLEILKKGHVNKVEHLLKKINFIGFNSYGEQFNGIHFNQTMIGVTVGKVKNE